MHTRWSGDNDSEPEEVLLNAIKLGLYGIAFTEHYSFQASEYAEKFREKYARDILILRGVEFSALEGHCLIFGADTDRLFIKHFPMKEIIKEVNGRGGVVIPSHPFRGINSVGEKIMELNGICALEGFNGCNLHALNLRAVESAKELGLPYTGGSDAHAPREVGSCYTEFHERPDMENFISLLRAGNYRGVDMRKISKPSFPI